MLSDDRFNYVLNEMKGEFFCFIDSFLTTLFETEKFSDELGIEFNFVFSDGDIEKICSNLADYFGRDVSNLKKRLKEMKKSIGFDANLESSDTCVRVKDYERFFVLLFEIRELYSSQMNGFYYGERLIKTIWLRMGVSDVVDVIAFLERQLEFIKKSNFFRSVPPEICGDLTLEVQNNANSDFFETNHHLDFVLSCESQDDDSGGACIETEYELPSIHYGLSFEDGVPTCYIYAIQNKRNRRQSELVRNKLSHELDRLQNDYVPEEIVMVLNLFIELLEKNGIIMIKVPLMQVYNYDYHVFLSEKSKEEYSNYSPIDLKRISRKIGRGKIDKETRKFLAVQATCNRFVDKQDIISEIKTERLIFSFLAVEEKYGNIEILSEPLVQGDCLIVRIKSKMQLLENGFLGKSM